MERERENVDFMRVELQWAVQKVMPKKTNDLIRDELCSEFRFMMRQLRDLEMKLRNFQVIHPWNGQLFNSLSNFSINFVIQSLQEGFFE